MDKYSLLKEKGGTGFVDELKKLNELHKKLTSF